ncbi:MAG: hypothetical protein V1880_02960 [Patescibacteria group bacterium]
MKFFRMFLAALVAFVAFTLATPAAWAQSPWGSPPSVRGSAAPAATVKPVAPPKGGGGPAMKDCDKEGKKIPANEWSKEKCDKPAEPDCLYGKDDNGACLTFEQAVEAYGNKRAAEASLLWKVALCVVSALLALVFAGFGFFYWKDTRRRLDDVAGAVVRNGERLDALEGRPPRAIPPAAP